MIKIIGGLEANRRLEIHETVEGVKYLKWPAAVFRAVTKFPFQLNHNEQPRFIKEKHRWEFYFKTHSGYNIQIETDIKLFLPDRKVNNVSTIYLYLYIAFDSEEDLMAFMLQHGEQFFKEFEE